MRVRHMRMNMRHRFMPVCVAMRAGRYDIVCMKMMTIAVRVRMLMFERLVMVFMRVALGQVQEHAGQHQQRTGAKPYRRAPLAQRIRNGGADERREREHRASACCAEFALRQKI